MTTMTTEKEMKEIMDLEAYISGVIDKQAAAINPYDYQYGFKDSRYLGARDAAKRMQDEMARSAFNVDIFTNYIMDENSLFQRDKKLDYYTKMTAKAKADYDRAYTDFFDSVAAEVRPNVKRDRHGNWKVNVTIKEKTERK